MRRVVSLATVSILLGAGCVTNFGVYNAREQKRMLASAAFELDCPAEQLTATPLEYETSNPESAVSKWGVRGCGSKAVYVRNWRKTSYNYDWILNSSGKDGGAASPAGPTPSPKQSH